MGKDLSYSHVEPVQHATLKLHEYLSRIYQYLKGHQKEIDRVFDSISEKMGVVLTTSLLSEMQVVDKKIKAFKTVIPQGYKPTMYHEAMDKLLAGMQGTALEEVADGQHPLYVFWHEALKAKLKTSWIEPAHYIDRIRDKASLYSRTETDYSLSWIEPAHWFDPTIEIGIDEKILISAIDEAYPDLQLQSRLVAIRNNLYDKIVNVKEPVQFNTRDQLDQIRNGDIKKAFSEISDIIKKYNL